jgi:hypothetical protein
MHNGCLYSTAEQRIAVVCVHYDELYERAVSHATTHNTALTGITWLRVLSYTVKTHGDGLWVIMAVN